MSSDRYVDHVSGEDAKVLWLNVIKRAVADFKAGPRANKSLYEDAKAWLFVDDEEFPSFVTVCDHLDVDVDFLRKRLLRELK